MKQRPLAVFSGGARVMIDKLQVWPMPADETDNPPRVSDGFHSRADFAAGKARRVHRGHDCMYRAKRAHKPPYGHPWRSKWYYVPQNPPIPALAAGPGKLLAARVLSTGGWVAIDHGDGVCTAYHHLRGVFVGNVACWTPTPDLVLGRPGVKVYSETFVDPFLVRSPIQIGDTVPVGYPIGLVGGSPRGYGLVHLHFDVAVDVNVDATFGLGRLAGRFVSVEHLLAKLRVLSLEEAWASSGRVEWDGEV
jgi:murein DD-endopeptidase MepM/ murein hydrolase activator NlpD